MALASCTVLSLFLITLPFLRQASASGADLTNLVKTYEVTLPLPDYGAPVHTEVIIDQTFANSYNELVTYNYVPPNVEFNRVTAEIGLETFGFQYDRLMHLFYDNIEIWRPSTPEPVGKNVTSIETKDLSAFLSLFQKPGQIEFSLPNIVTTQNAGVYYTNVTLTFYNDLNTPEVTDDSWFYSEPPSKIEPVISQLAYAAQSPVNGSIPSVSRNTTRAILNVFASGNSQEEFWYSNDPSTGGPTRLIEVYVAGELVGIADPFAVVYTGGWDPALWQPLMGIDASAVPSYIVDVTPLLPTLWEEEESTEVVVAIGNGYNSTEAILSNWIVSAALFTWEVPNLQGSAKASPTITKSGSGNVHVYGENSTYESLEAFYNHGVYTSAELTYTDTTTNKTYSGIASWSQQAKMSNNLENTDSATIVKQTGEGYSRSNWQASNGTSISYRRTHSYPFSAKYVQGSNMLLIGFNRTLDAEVDSNSRPFSVAINQEASVGPSGVQSINDVYSGNYHRHAVAEHDTVISDTSN